MNQQKKILSTIFTIISCISLTTVYGKPNDPKNIPQKVVEPTPILIVGETPVTLISSIGKSEFSIESFDLIGGNAHSMVLQSSLVNPIVKEEMPILIDARKKSPRLFVPDRLIAKAIKKVFDPRGLYTYQGKPIVDEYNKGHSFRLSLNNENQVHDFVTFFREHEGVLKTQAVKPMLYIQSHPISVFSPEETATLKKYFTIDDSIATRTFFVESHKKFVEIDPTSFGEEYKTTLETLYNYAISDFKKGKSEKIIPSFIRSALPTAVNYVVGYILLDSLINLISSKNRPTMKEKVKEAFTRENIADIFRKFVEGKYAAAKK